MGRSYEDLLAWQRAMDLVTAVYQATESFPAKEMYGLTNQMRRAAVSIPSNIAEGQARLSTKEFRHHLSIARGSLMELKTQIQISQNLRYLAPDAAVRLLAPANELGRILNGLIASIQGASLATNN